MNETQLNIENNASAPLAKLEGEKSAIDLATPGVAKLVAKRILEDIDRYCQEAYDDGARKHLGASLIGRSCNRYLWYVFRWCLHEKHSGRVLRLFNRGHREEARFIEWLEGIGCTVWHQDENGKQFRISAAKGHFGGSMDAIIKLPPHYGIDEVVLGEFKTNGTGAGFNKLDEKGMALAKPDHFAQTSVYGADENYNFRYVLYLNINKNDDTIYPELVKLNHQLGQQMKIKAEKIIFSQTPPPRLSESPMYFDCKFCAMAGICHKGAMPEKNCRSCSSALPVDDGQWLCQTHNAIIPDDVIKIGCENYYAITNTVRG